MLLFIVTSASTLDISSSDHLYVFSKASFVIYKNPSLSDNTSILSVYLQLVLVLLMVYAIVVLFFVQW